MASLQKKGDSWHCQFRFKNQRHTWVIGPVEEIEARAIKAKVEYLLMRIKQHLIDLPAGMDIVTFIKCDGKPPEYVTVRQEEYTFGQVREAWIWTHSNGTIEQNTLATCKLHLSHIVNTLGAVPHQRPNLSRPATACGPPCKRQKPQSYHLARHHQERSCHLIRRMAVGQPHGNGDGTVPRPGITLSQDRGTAALHDLGGSRARHRRRRLGRFMGQSDALRTRRRELNHSSQAGSRPMRGLRRCLLIHKMPNCQLDN